MLILLTTLVAVASSGSTRFTTSGELVWHDDTNATVWDPTNRHAPHVGGGPWTSVRPEHQLVRRSRRLRGPHGDCSLPGSLLRAAPGQALVLEGEDLPGDPGVG